MLSLIRVKNYAVIDEAELELDAGFSVITGETGAGKSIIVDALALALGDRADASVVRLGAERAEVSAVFECPPEHAALAWLAERSLDDGTNVTLRRVIGSEGRSKAFINGQPATLQDLRALGELLVDIHGQHAHQSLLQAAEQRSLLDAHGRLEKRAAAVARAFREWQALERELGARREGSAAHEAELERLRYELGELEVLALEAGEVEELRAERDRLANVDRLAAGAAEAHTLVYGSDQPSAHSLVASAQRALARVAELDAELAEPRRLLAEAEIGLREVGSALARYLDRIEADPARLEWLEARLAKIRVLARRHDVAEEELHGLAAVLRERLDALAGRHASLEELEAAVARARETYFAAARELSAARRKHARALGKAVTAQLRELGMPDGELSVLLHEKPESQADATGLERVELQVRMNVGQAPGPLARVASGGELSRIGLAIEVVRSGASPVGTFVFDEVDAGIGGRVAEIVGRRLAEIARHRQVLCVTHLPQVASQARHHFRVAKLTDRGTTRTEVRRLTDAERVEELSRMLGGIEITERTRAHAAEMIGRATK
ncbi:MAG TPA: DNA repair protein RecN [Gammaproteobacteria bacterium]